MKKLHLFTIILITLFISCSKDKYDTGIKGVVTYGQGDCMPIIDTTSRIYSNYSGTIYFIVKQDLDSLNNVDFDILKNSSVSSNSKNGEYSIELPTGTYVVMPEDVYLYSSSNTITINSGEILIKDFKFWKCTSY